MMVETRTSMLNKMLYHHYNTDETRQHSNADDRDVGITLINSRPNHN